MRGYLTRLLYCYRPFLQRLRAGKEMGDCSDHRPPAIARFQALAGLCLQYRRLMKTIIYKPHFSLLLSIVLLVFGCTSFENEQKPISSTEGTIDINIGEVIRSGEFEQRVETEQIPQNNCDGKSSFVFSVSRERTLEQSVDLTLQGQGGGELELAGKPMEVGAAGKVKAAIGAAYGQSGSKSISDSGGM